MDDQDQPDQPGHPGQPGQPEQHESQAPRAPSPPAVTPGRDEMDRIRLRRLEKLGGPSPSPSNDPSNRNSPAPSGASTPFSAPYKASSKAPTPAPTPTPTPTRKPTNPPAQATAPKRPASTSITIDHRPRKVSPPESPEDFADLVLTRVFRISVDPTKKSDTLGNRLIFLANSSAELQEADMPLKLTVDNIDQYLFEAGAKWPKSKPLFQYFLACWKRLVDMAASLRNPSQAKLDTLTETRRMAVSHCIFCLTIPDLYNRESNPMHDTVGPYLMCEYGSELSMPLDLVSDVVKRFDEDDTVAAIFVKSMHQLSLELSAKGIRSGDFSQYFQALEMCTNFSPILEALSADSSFNPPRSPQEIEHRSLLGPFFRLSPIHPDDAIHYYHTPTKPLPTSVNNGNSGVRADLGRVWDRLYHVANAFVRAGEQPRSRLLSWFAYILNTNHKRAATYPPKKDLATDGFMLNISVVLDRLCEPFMDATFSKVGRIEADYFRRNPRVDISDETKLCANDVESSQFYEDSLPGNSNFISEIFFLNLAGHYYGAESLQTTYKNLEYETRQFASNIEEMQRTRPNLPASELPRMDIALARFKDGLEKFSAMRLAIHGALTIESMQQVSLRFMRYVAVWLLRLASGTVYVPGGEMKLPLPDQAPVAFTCLPEFAASVVLKNLKFAFEKTPQLCTSAFGDEMFIFCITFLQAKGYIKNPGIKTDLVNALRMGTLQLYHQTKGIWGDLLMNHQFSHRFLLRSLMDFYIESESTIDFYSKFNVRYTIFEVIKAVWPNDEYKRQLARESRVNKQFFVHFVKLVLNDATYVLDEALTRFPKIHDLEVELRTTSMTQQDKETKEKSLRQLESQASGYMQLTNSIMDMMVLFTGAMNEAFVMPEIVERLALMLDFNVKVLTGPKSRTLKIDKMAQFQFEPKKLLGQFVDVYLCLGASDDFVGAVAQDGRSYSPQDMDNATRILEKIQVKSPQDMLRWRKLLQKFMEKKEEQDQAAVDMGDIPAEFEDPLLSHLMKDPVVLPSGNVLDRQTIIEHLLSSAMDPFTRQPMTIEDAKPATELKEKIERWKAERIAEARAKKMREMDEERERERQRVAELRAKMKERDEEGDAMDTSEG